MAKTDLTKGLLSRFDRLQGQRAMERKRKGRRSTILTGPLGVEEEAETEKKTLLGS